MFKKIKSWFLKIFGDIKVFKWPMFLVYDPVLYQLTGKQVRQMMNTLQVGDIVARAYVHYLDGYFISGKYTHTGIYIGDGKVIHAVAEGVSEIDILDFLQADKCAIIRPKKKDMIEQAVKRAHEYIGTKYDFFFTEGDDALYCHELTASCYSGCDIQKHIATACFGLLRKKEPVYLAQSFTESPDFEVILELE